MSQLGNYVGVGGGQCANSASISYFDLNTGLYFGQVLVKCHRGFPFWLELDEINTSLLTRMVMDTSPLPPSSQHVSGNKLFLSENSYNLKVLHWISDKGGQPQPELLTFPSFLLLFYPSSRSPSP